MGCSDFCKLYSLLVKDVAKIINIPEIVRNVKIFHHQGTKHFRLVHQESHGMKQKIPKEMKYPKAIKGGKKKTLNKKNTKKMKTPKAIQEGKMKTLDKKNNKNMKNPKAVQGGQGKIPPKNNKNNNKMIPRKWHFNY